MTSSREEESGPGYWFPFHIRSHSPQGKGINHKPREMLENAKKMPDRTPGGGRLHPITGGGASAGVTRLRRRWLIFPASDCLSTQPVR